MLSLIVLIYLLLATVSAIVGMIRNH